MEKGGHRVMARERAGADEDGSTEAVFHALLRTWGLLRRAQEPYFARFHITGSQWGILRVLERAELSGERQLSLKEVAQRLLIQPPSVTGAVDRLERQGLVQRRSSSADLRVRHLGLSPAGRRLVAKVLGHHTERINSLFVPLQPGDRRTLLQLLARLEASLESAIAQQSAGSVGPRSSKRSLDKETGDFEP